MFVVAFQVITKPEAEPIGRQHRMGGATFLLASPETNDWFVKVNARPLRWMDLN